MINPKVERIKKQYLEKSERPSEYIIIARVSGDQWKVLNAEHPMNLFNNQNPRDLNVLCDSLASQGCEVYALAYRGKDYVSITALGAVTNDS